MAPPQVLEELDHEHERRLRQQARDETAGTPSEEQPARPLREAADPERAGTDGRR
jgi:hypothetical protein